MEELKFSTGEKVYTINGKHEFSFNPTDNFFVEKLYSAFEILDKKQDYYKNKIQTIGNKKEIFDFAREMDKEMREIIDDIFGEKASCAIFGGMNVYSLADGMPVWANLMLAVMDEIDTSYTREQKAMNPRINKYTAKYQKYMK